MIQLKRRLQSRRSSTRLGLNEGGHYMEHVFYDRNNANERLSERSGLRMSVPTYRTNILYEDMIRYDERGITYTNQKVLAANGSVACLNPTLGPQPSLM
jgi:hypothetical protein